LLWYYTVGVGRDEFVASDAEGGGQNTATHSVRSVNALQHSSYAANLLRFWVAFLGEATNQPA
jgi:hypothetical protein